DLALCYWREGAFDEARVHLRDLLKLDDLQGEQRARALLNSAEVERASMHHHEALAILTEAAPLFEAGLDFALKGKFHNTRALVLRNLGEAEHRQDYIDSALEEYTAASFYLEKAGHTRFRARVENNLGFLFFTLNRFSEAHTHLDCARILSIKDSGRVAEVDDT